MNKKLNWWIETTNTDRMVLYKNNVIDSSHTGDTNEYLLHSYLIPANTLRTTDIVECTALFGTNTSGGGGTNTYRFRVHTSSALSGQTVMSAGFAATSTYVKIQRQLKLNNSLTSTDYMATVAVNFDLTSQAVAITTDTTINWGVDQYFIVSVALGGAASNVNLKSLLLEVIR